MVVLLQPNGPVYLLEAHYVQGAVVNNVVVVVGMLGKGGGQGEKASRPPSLIGLANSPLDGAWCRGGENGFCSDSAHH